VACRRLLRAHRGRPAALPIASLSLAAMSVSSSAPPAKKKKSLGEILETAGQKALRGGLPGMVAMGVQVR